MPRLREARPRMVMSGRALAVSGATAPLLNEVVVVAGTGAGVGAAGAMATVEVTVSVRTLDGTPAAESTHARISLNVTRVMLSVRALATATIAALAESA